MKWCRLYSEIIDDPKMRKLTGEQFRHFVMLLALASEQEKEGEIDMALDDIAWRLRIDIEELNKTIGRLKELRILENGAQNPILINWKKRQFRSDSSAERVKRHREKNKKRDCNVTVTPRARAESETESETEKEDQPPAAFSSLFEQHREPLKEICEKIWARKDRGDFNPFAFSTKHVKMRAHPGAVVASLTKLNHYWKSAGNKWGYAEKILLVENGNFYEQDRVEEAQKDKIDFNIIVKAIEGFVKGVKS